MEGIATLKKQTRRFINDNPTDIVLMRRVEVEDGAGGFTHTDKPLDPQRMRVVETAGPGGVTSRNVAGSVDRPQRSIIAELDADIQETDKFTYQGMPCVIGYVQMLPYEIIAEVNHA